MIQTVLLLKDSGHSLYFIFSVPWFPADQLQTPSVTGRDALRLTLAKITLDQLNILRIHINATYRADVRA